MLTDVAELYATSPVLFTGSVFVLGLVIGSFLNVVIYRLPIMLEREWRAQAAEISPTAGTAQVRPTLQALARRRLRAARALQSGRSRAPPVPSARPRSPPGRTSP